MANATFVVSVGAAPTATTTDGVESLELIAQVPDPNDPVNLVVRVKAGSRQAELLQTKTAGDLLILSGLLFLEDSQPVITPQVICPATDQQYLNEVVLVGNLAKPGRETEQTVLRSLGQSRPVMKNGTWEELTDWFLIRGYASKNGGTSIKDRLNDAAKGSLVEVTGTLSQRTSKSNETYVEVKARKFRVHKRGGNGQSPNPAAGKNVVGYEADAFTSDDDMPAF